MVRDRTRRHDHRALLTTDDIRQRRLFDRRCAQRTQDQRRFGVGDIALDATALVGRECIRIEHAPVSACIAPESAFHAGHLRQHDIENGVHQIGVRIEMIGAGGSVDGEIVARRHRLAAGQTALASDVDTPSRVFLGHEQHEGAKQRAHDCHKRPEEG